MKVKDADRTVRFFTIPATSPLVPVYRASERVIRINLRSARRDRRSAKLALPFDLAKLAQQTDANVFYLPLPL